MKVYEPSLIRQRLAAGEGVPLRGGITNRNYRMSFDGVECVVRLPGHDTGLLGIDRRAEALAAQQAAALGIGPAVLHADDELFVTEFVHGTEADPELLRSDPAPLARALRAFHESALDLPTRFWVPELLGVYAKLVSDRGAELPAAYARAQELVDRIARAIPFSDPVPCHNDLLAGNVILVAASASAAGGLLLVDWEYAGLGHRLFDLANLAVNNGFDERAELRLLEAYLGRPAARRQLAALRLFRIVSDAREAAWGVVQSLISELDFDFTTYADEHFERLERAAADPSLEEYLNAATT